MISPNSSSSSGFRHKKMLVIPNRLQPVRNLVLVYDDKKSRFLAPLGMTRQKKLQITSVKKPG
jgi:hypothetical protein